MLEEEIKKAGKNPFLKRTKKPFWAGAFGLIASILAGFLVWSINGRFVTTTHHDTGYSSWDTVTSSSLDPAVQGALAFLTVGLLIVSLAILTSSRDS